MLYNIKYCFNLLQIQQKAVPLHQVFHGIRFKVNKGWVKALTLFLYLYVSYPVIFHSAKQLIIRNRLLIRMLKNIIARNNL